MRLLGWGCAFVAIGFLALSLPLRCVKQAGEIGGFSLLDGAVMGACLALITRTRRPTWIYLLLAAAMLTLWPIVVAWPPGDPEAIHPWRGAPEIATNYFDALRVCLFLAGIPYPFVRLGHHAPDLPPPENPPVSSPSG
ncbi:MAG TPA: hypothetical protein VFA07_16165 [Chthonomonadaceae bacterium]|nr:hypothetical protein [Chthonomonadaceae bacterium]